MPKGFIYFHCYARSIPQRDPKAANVLAHFSSLDVHMNSPQYFVTLLFSLKDAASKHFMYYGPAWDHRVIAHEGCSRGEVMRVGYLPSHRVWDRDEREASSRAH